MNYLTYGARYINLFIESVTYIRNYVSDLTLNLYKQTTADTLVFFDKNPTPYFSSYLDLKNKQNGVIVWKYNINKKLFYQYNCIVKDTKRYPIMSAHIESENDTIYLDDFIHSIRIESSNVGYPSLQQLMEVWSYSYGIVLNRNTNYDIIYLDNDVNEVRLDLFTGSFNF